MTNYIKTWPITVDAITTPKNSNTDNVVFNQGDLNEDQLAITLTFSNNAMDLTTASTIEIYFQPQGGAVTKQDLTNGISVTSAVQGQINLSLNSQTIATPGTVTAEVHVTYPNNQVIVFKKFTFTVESSLTSSISSQNNYQVLTAMQYVTSISSLPAASANLRGVFYFVEGASGAADAVYICKKLSDDTYDWVQYA